MSDLRRPQNQVTTIRVSTVKPDVPNEIRAVNEVANWAKEAQRSGNFLTSSLHMIRHVSQDEGLSERESARLGGILEDLEGHHEHQLANIYAFRHAMITREETFTGSADQSDEWFFRLPLVGEANPSGSDQESNQYWRSVRDELKSSLRASLSDLSRSLGISYATIANLGKRRPQGRTVAPIMRLYSLVRACVEVEGERGTTWLAGSGRKCLFEDGIDAFDSAVSTRIFVRTSRAKVADQPDKDEPETWSAPLDGRSLGERF